MSDDIWRRQDDNNDEPEYGTDFGSDFGRVQFAEDATSESPLTLTGDTGTLPHWTEPPTGEVPRFTESQDDSASNVWETFQQRPDPTTRAEKISIGTDPTGDRARRPEPKDASYEIPSDPSYDITGGHEKPRSTRPQQVRRSASAGPTRSSKGGRTGRDIPTAVSTGLILFAAFIAAEMWRPIAVLLIVTVILGLAGVEFFGKVTEKGYRPATVAGLAACVSAPLAAYWIGDAALPLVVVFAFIAVSIGFVGAQGVQSGPMPNTAITSMAVVWIGLLGSFAALILRYSTNAALPSSIGTDTLFLIVAGVVANDVGALIIGSSIGRTPVREWVSPGKTVEGLAGGAIATLVAVVLVGSQSDTWNSASHLVLLALVIAVMAPLGDLVESMFKRNLDVKDFGSIVPGHGGVLDRFDSFFFVLPSAYYLMLVLEPWVK
ncbi:MAG: hypothetical protein EXQ63_05530 [Ilumatobacteraceae bacterium]|nr:hypothetical protein [Ilumatobacteraceae bacterium]